MITEDNYPFTLYNYTQIQLDLVIIPMGVVDAGDVSSDSDSDSDTEDDPDSDGGGFDTDNDSDGGMGDNRGEGETIEEKIGSIEDRLKKSKTVYACKKVKTHTMFREFMALFESYKIN